MKHESALNAFEGGCNCAQAVFTEFCADYGVDKDTGMKLSQCFGGGGAGRGDMMCGVVSAMLMLSGLDVGGAPEQKKEAYSTASQMVDAFIKKHNTVICNELKLGAKEKFNRDERMINHKGCRSCAVFVLDACEIFENMRKK